MEMLKWSQDMSLDIPTLDLAHQRFLQMLSDIASAPDSKFRSKFISLIKELEIDFREEEELMEELQFYEIQPHREQHARVLYALHKVIPDVHRGQFESAKQTLELLPKWFLFHLSVVDKLLSIWFKLKHTDATLDACFNEQDSVVPQYVKPRVADPYASTSASHLPHSTI